MTKTRKASERRSLRIWVESEQFWTRQAKWYFQVRHTFTLGLGADGKFTEDPTIQEAYDACRTKFNEARRQVKVNRRRIARSAASYLKNYKGK